jgi:hypothetical protein
MYQLSFQLGINNPDAEQGASSPAQDFNVTLGGVNIYHEAEGPGLTPGATPCTGFATGCIQLTTHTVDFTATANNEIIAFGGLNFPATDVLTNKRRALALNRAGPIAAVPGPIAGAGLPGLT